MTSESAADPGSAPVDPFFQLVPGGKFNACIGRQGSEEDYVDAYLEAAQELVAAVVDKEQLGKRDTLAMPILYNARHAVELSLKFAIKHLHELGRLKESYRANHDIERHWAQLRDSMVGDAVARQAIADIEPYVRSLASIDEDGQELRYATNRAGERSLQDRSLINLELVQASLEHLAELLKTLKYRALDLFEEKATGTWMAECSRSDLLEIARLLPPRTEWNTEAFNVAKSKIKDEFGLGNAKFAAALKIIETSRATRAVIGLETPLAHLTDDHVLLVLKQWSQQHPLPRDADRENGPLVYPRKVNWAEHRDRRMRSGHLNDEVLKALRPEEIADLETVFYIGRERRFPEFYDRMLTRILREHAVENDLPSELRHLMDKTNLGTDLESGARRLGATSLANTIAEFLRTRR
jgi:hypothetical protein